MGGTKAYYSLIQYCPDASRAEAANLGVLLFCPEQNFLDARVSDSNARVAKFFGRKSFDPKRLNAIKHGLVKRLEIDHQSLQTLEDVEQFIATRANDMRITSPRPMKSDNPEADLFALFQELVGGQAIARAEELPRFPQLDAAFHDPRLIGKVRFGFSVKTPVIGKTFRADYAYNNGSLNLVKPHEFPAKKGSATRSALTLAAEGDLIQSEPDPVHGPMRLIVVSQFPPEVNGARERIDELFEHYKVRLIPSENIKSFIDEVAREAH